jgi:hypothetical protein
MERLLLLYASHFLGDFPFQGEWMVVNKGKSREVLCYHVAVYVSTMCLFMRLAGYRPTLEGLLVDAVTHFVIDTLKCRGIIGSIWLDQLCHLTVRTALWSVGWL